MSLNWYSNFGPQSVDEMLKRPTTELKERENKKNQHLTNTRGTEVESKQNPTNMQNSLTLRCFNALFNIRLSKQRRDQDMPQ